VSRSFWESWIYNEFIKRVEIRTLVRARGAEKKRVSRIGTWKKKSRKVRHRNPRQIKALSQLYAELWKEHGDEYEPGSLEGVQKSKSYRKSILRDRAFINTRKVLKGKAPKLKEQGKGKRRNRSKSLTKEKKETLLENGQLGGKCPRSLVNTMWWLMTQHFGLRVKSITKWR